MEVLRLKVTFSDTWRPSFPDLSTDLPLILFLLNIVPFAVSAVPVTDSSTVPPISVPVVTKYMTTEVQTLGQDEPITMIGQLCASAKGMELQVTVMLNNNPDWDPTFGVLYYYVVDDPNKVR